MADVKISGLTAVSAVEANDLLEVSEDTGGGTYASRKATATQIKGYVLGTTNVSFTGPTAARTYTLPDASTTLLSTNAVVTVAQGGTGATNAATARTNLGVVALAGDTMTGNLTVPSLNSGPLAGFRNVLINGNFDIWQRGTSFSNPAFNAYTADRWVVTYNGTGATRTLSRQTFTPGQTDVPYNPKYFFRYNQSVAGTGGTYSVIEQRIEGVNTFAGQQVTLSFYAKAGASISLPSLDVAQVFGTGGSPSTAVITNINGAQAITTSWAKYQYTFTVPSISGKTRGTNDDDALNLYIAVPVNSTFTFDLAQVQLEAGPLATPFERRPIGTELALCQRYYQQYQNPPARGVANSSTSINRVGFSLPVIMRVAPTGSLSGSLNWFDGTGVVTISAISTTYSTPHSFEFDATTAGTATYRPIIIYIGGNTGTINLSAEL